MHNVDRQLLKPLMTGDKATRLAAARAALESGTTEFAERSHPIVVAVAELQTRKRRKLNLTPLFVSLSLIVIFLVVWIAFDGSSIHFPGWLFPLLMLLAAWWPPQRWTRKEDDADFEIPPYRGVEELPNEAHSLGAINGLAPLMASEQLAVRQDVARALHPTLPCLDADLAPYLSGNTVHGLARATEDRELPIRFRLDLMKALERIADDRAEECVARTLADCQYDPLMRDAAATALEAIRANKRNNTLLRPTDAPKADSLLRPAANTEADSESLLRPTLNTPNGG